MCSSCGIGGFFFKRERQLNGSGGLLAWRPILESSHNASGLLEFRSLPHRKTIGEQLIHIANAERWYLVRIHPQLPRLPNSKTPWERLSAVRGLVEHTLRSMRTDQLAVQNVVGGELWSPRKVVRRLMYHEQFHRDTIVRDLRVATAQHGLRSIPDGPRPNA